MVRQNANKVLCPFLRLLETQLGSAPDVVGRKVLVNRHPLTIIGVAASTFKGIDVGCVHPSDPGQFRAQAIPVSAIF